MLLESARVPGDGGCAAVPAGRRGVACGCAGRLAVTWRAAVAVLLRCLWAPLPGRPSRAGSGCRPAGWSAGDFCRCNSVDRITTTTRRLALRPWLGVVGLHGALLAVADYGEPLGADALCLEHPHDAAGAGGRSSQFE